MQRRIIYALIVAAAVALGLLFQPKTAHEAEIVVPEAKAAELIEVVDEPKVEPIVDPRIAALKQYLEAKKSPMAAIPETLLAQGNVKLIIAISFAESNYCRQIPKQLVKGAWIPNYNCWGVGGSSGLQKYGSDISAAVIKFNTFLNSSPKKKPYAKQTFDEMNGVYCQNANYAGKECPNWEEKLQKVYKELEKIGL